MTHYNNDHSRELAPMRDYYVDQQAKIDRSALYYDYVFQQIIDGKRPLPNWAAALFQSVWLIYRKNYIPAFVLSLVMSLLDTILSKVIVGTGFGLILGIFLFCAFAFEGNKYYFNQIKKKLNRTPPIQPAEQNTDQLAAILLFMITMLQVATSGASGTTSKLYWLVFICYWLWIFLDRHKLQGTKNT